MQGQRWVSLVEFGCLFLLYVWLAWLPLPFGSVIERAQFPLIAVPLALCALSALIRLYSTFDRGSAPQLTRPWRVFALGSGALLVFCAFQIVPLPRGLHRLLTPEGNAIWEAGSNLARLAGLPARDAYPITIDPAATRLELFRLTALFAAFTTGALLVRTHSRRVALACVLCITAGFEAIYGLREAALQRYEIWGWVNRLVFNRVTGTFVNPDHFAHYLAIVLPMGIFLIASKWHVAGSHRAPASQRFMNLLEHGVIRSGFGILAAICCIVGILLAQSRGALLSLGTGLLAVAAMLPGRRLLRIALASASGVALVVVFVFYLGSDRTVARFVPSKLEERTLVGRRIGIGAAVGVWQRFPLTGSGVGTFARVVSMEQREDLDKIYHHAHNDYMEMAATTGVLGLAIVFTTLVFGYGTLAQMTFGESSKTIAWRRRAFQVAVLASLTIAMIHSLFDFNFFIPSNPATLAVMTGAAVATLHHDKRTRR